MKIFFVTCKYTLVKFSYSVVRLTDMKWKNDNFCFPCTDMMVNNDNFPSNILKLSNNNFDINLNLYDWD